MNTVKTKRAFLYAPGDFRVEEMDLTYTDDQVLVKVASCGLCTWELNHWKGIIQTEGYPYSLGHEFAGTIVEVGKNVTGFKVGDKVAALTPFPYQGFSEYAACDPTRCFKLAEHIDPKYVLGEPLKCVVTVLGAVSPQPGDYGVVQGCGPMGLWCVQALSGTFLGGLIAVDIDDAKLELAKKFGATATINSKKENVVERIKELTGGHMADFAIEGTGIPVLLDAAQDFLKRGRGRLILMSSHEESCKNFDFRKAISKGLELKVPHPPYALNGLDDMRRAIALVNSGAFRVEPVISHQFKLDDIMEAFHALENRPAGYLKGMVCPE